MDRLKFLDKVIKVDDVDTLRRYFNLLMRMSQSYPKYKQILVRDLSYVKKQIGGENKKITKYIYVFPKKNGTYPEEYRYISKKIIPEGKLVAIAIPVEEEEKEEEKEKEKKKKEEEEKKKIKEEKED